MTATATSPSGPSLASLSGLLSRPLILPAASGYPAAARIYNPRFDAGAKPIAVARCATATDVQRCVQYATESRTALHLRSGGHSYGGWSTGSGLVVDVGPMAAVAVDTAAHTARIGAGARLVQVYESLAAKGVSLAAGSCPSVGITGLTLGGGVGVLTRAYGLTADAVRSVQLVTADGQLREVDASHDPDLFWALRGGGSGFGAVTAFTVAVRPAPAVQTFYFQWPVAAAAQVISAWQSWIVGADPQLWSTCKLLADPPSGQVQVTVSGSWVGSKQTLTAQLSPLLKAIGARAAVNQANGLTYLQTMQLEAGCLGMGSAQCLATALAAPKRQPFSATSAILSVPLPEAGIAAAVTTVSAGLSVRGMVEGGLSLDALGGAVAGVRPADTAFIHRDALALVQYTATWAATAAAANPAPYDRYVRGLRAKLAPWTGTAAYVNYADPAITEYETAYWGSNLPRLQQVKRQYDPSDLFASGQTVKP